MKAMAVTAACGMWIVTASSLYAGPFGVDLDQFDPPSMNCTSLPKQPWIYECPATVIPAPVKQFKSYSVYWSPNVGVCSFRAISPNPHGKKISGSFKENVSSIISTLIMKYGDDFGSANMQREISDWRTDVWLYWPNIQGDGFSSVMINYYDGLGDDYPSLPYFEAGFQVTYFREEISKCIEDARSLLPPDLNIEQGMRSKPLEERL